MGHTESDDVPATGLYDRPVLVVDLSLHTASVNGVDVDAQNLLAVTGSADRTVRIWSIADGTLVRTIRLPAGPGLIGQVYAVAMSPDGGLVAAGGWTRQTPADPHEHVYLFNTTSGALVKRIVGMPQAVLQLAFSRDGRYLAAAMAAGNGLCIFDRDADWAKSAWQDGNYSGHVYGADFSPDGCLTTMSTDGFVQVYQPVAIDEGVMWIIANASEAPGFLRNCKPFRCAYSPDGKRLAIGYDNIRLVSVHDAETLELLGIHHSDTHYGSPSIVAWSVDGRTLYAGGTCSTGDVCPVLAWREGGEHQEYAASRDTIKGLKGVSGGLLVAAADPYLALLDEEGGERWVHKSPVADFRSRSKTLAVAFDGTIVDFGHTEEEETPTRFDLGALDALGPAPANDGRTKRPIQLSCVEEAIEVINKFGHLPSLEPGERIRCHAIDPRGDAVVLGADYTLVAYHGGVRLLWGHRYPAPVVAVNITGDGRLVVAAYFDGTIRWYRMNDGVELLALFTFADCRNWVAWTPDGYYAATSATHGVLRWHVNHGWDAPAEAILISEIAGSYRPEVLRLVIQEMDIVRALGLAEIQKHRREIQLRTRSTVPPGSQLHVLAIGLSDYGEQAKHLRLHFADQDARDIASTLVTTQEGLYAKVSLQLLENGRATQAGIYAGFSTVREKMSQGSGQDLAVVLFSGHGAIVDGGFYLFTYGIDARTPELIKATALSADAFRREVHKLGEHGRVMVLLDACRSGTVTADGTDLPLDADLLRVALAKANVTVLTSSCADEKSREDSRWKNGAFTEVFLEALNSADTDRNGLVGVTDLVRYLTTQVPRLTENAQTPGIEVRFESDVFVAGLRDLLRGAENKLTVYNTFAS